MTKIPIKTFNAHRSEHKDTKDNYERFSWRTIILNCKVGENNNGNRLLQFKLLNKNGKDVAQKENAIYIRNNTLHYYKSDIDDEGEDNAGWCSISIINDKKCLPWDRIGSRSLRLDYVGKIKTVLLPKNLEGIFYIEINTLFCDIEVYSDKKSVRINYFDLYDENELNDNDEVLEF